MKAVNGNKVLPILVVLFNIHGCVKSEVRRQSAEDNDYCVVEGHRYRPGERIPRDNVCHICLCHLGKAECAWMNCPPPPEGCIELSFPHLCNPTLYLCPIPKELVGVRYEGRVKRRSRRASDLDPMDFEERNRITGDCNVLGVPYRTGDVMGVATNPCLECRCAQQDMYCSPRCCFRASSLYENPSQLLRMISQRAPKLPERHPLYHLQRT